MAEAVMQLGLAHVAERCLFDDFLKQGFVRIGKTEKFRRAADDLPRICMHFLVRNPEEITRHITRFGPGIIERYDCVDATLFFVNEGRDIAIDHLHSILGVEIIGYQNVTRIAREQQNPLIAIAGLVFFYLVSEFEIWAVVMSEADVRNARRKFPEVLKLHRVFDLEPILIAHHAADHRSKPGSAGLWIGQDIAVSRPGTR